MDVWIKTKNRNAIVKSVEKTTLHGEYGVVIDNCYLGKYPSESAMNTAFDYICEEIHQAILKGESAVYIELPEG